MSTQTGTKPVPPVAQTDAGTQGQHFKYYDLCMAAFVTLLICANVIGAAKQTTILGVTFGAGILFFPLSYVLGDVLTEVYGYARARRVVWAGFAAGGFAAFMSFVIVAMPPEAGWTSQAAYETVFGQVPRIVFASLIAFWVGEFANAYVMAKMKVWTQGKHLWSRTIGSTIVGQSFDSLIFYPVAFLGVWETSTVLTIMGTNFAFKVLWEAFLTPVTYKVVAALKKAENVDIFDKDTNFTPFTLKG
ncbi:MAG: VUT family protein [Alphaproteobacteria bacterium]|nr:MAG: VUT family protein [Alphaproteobacteria bacterium]